MNDNDPALALARNVQDACIRAALDGYENAAISGLCREGAWEAAISAIRMLDLDDIINNSRATGTAMSETGKQNSRF